METWRIIATALFGAVAIILLLIIMAKVRERTDSASSTAIAGAIVLSASAILAVLMFTVLNPPLTWAIVGMAGVVVTVMVLAS